MARKPWKRPSCFSLLSTPNLVAAMAAAAILVSSAAAAAEEKIVDDKVAGGLPGQPPEPTMSQFSGYITVDKGNGRALFYWFFEAQSLPSERPLLLWFNGGPGCSSIGYGAAMEIGPLKVKPNGTGLEFNKHSWYQVSNLLFLESPVGVGFSYTNTSSDLPSRLQDTLVAEDAYNFLVEWLKRCPQYQSHDLYIGGESYAGHYVPQLSELIFDRNKDGDDINHPHINLKGFMVGNPETDLYNDTKGLVQYAWSHAVISDQTFRRVEEICDFKFRQAAAAAGWGGAECDAAIGSVFRQYGDINIYDIYAPKCTNPTSTQLPPSPSPAASHPAGAAAVARMPSGYDPCYSGSVEEYFNRADVQRALHANLTGKIQGRWKACSDSILGSYNFTVFSVLPIYSKLIKGGIRIWVYSGDADGRVPVIGTRYWVEDLGLPIKTQWQPWFHRNQVGGRVVEYEGLTMATVRGAGHLVPLNKPSEALTLVDAFLAGRSLPTHDRRR